MSCTLPEFLAHAVAMESYRAVAGEFAAEEKEHLAALDQWIGRTPRPSETWARDPAHRC